MASGPRSGQTEDDAHGEVERAEAYLSVLAESLTLERPRAERRVRADEPSRDYAIAIPSGREPDEHSEDERARDVHGERADGEGGPGTQGDGAVEREARD